MDHAAAVKTAPGICRIGDILQLGSAVYNDRNISDKIPREATARKLIISPVSSPSTGIY